MNYYLQFPAQICLSSCLKMYLYYYLAPGCNKEVRTVYRGESDAKAVWISSLALASTSASEVSLYQTLLVSLVSTSAQWGAVTIIMWDKK